MKIKLFALVFGLIISALYLTSCNKCVTCVPYFKQFKDSIDGRSEQSIYTCSKTDIKAYENGTDYIDSYNDSIYFKCQ